MHEDLLAALRDGPGLVVVTGPTGHGKTTVIESVLADRRCPRGVLFVGDIPGDVDPALRAIEAGRSNVAVAVLRIPTSEGAFERLLDVGVPRDDVVNVVRVVFTVRLFRPPPRFLLVHEQLDVSARIRALVNDSPRDGAAIRRQAIAEGMRPLKDTVAEHVRLGHLTSEAVASMGHSR